MSAEHPDGRDGWTRVQRVVFPDPGDRDVLPLYVLAGDEARWTRGSLTIPAGGKASTGAYFGTFPAAYWLAHTAVRRVRLTATVQPAARIRIRASDAAGQCRTLDEFDVDGDAAVEVALDDRASGRVWFDVVAAASETTISAIAWSVPGRIEHPATATVCITTFHRQLDCIALLRTIASDAEALARLTQIVVVDQGDRLVRDAAGFDAVEVALRSQLRLIEQPNLGGSGGFSRGMLAAADGGASHALLLDDDVVLEPESILRMLSFADYARGPRIVGAHMLSLTERTVLHSLGERVDREGFWWEPVVPELAPVDLARDTVQNTPGLSGRVDVDFNGWWMCLIPTATIRELGASLPLFIKWDDAEFGLRASAAGVATVTLPGAALWHMPWTAKDDGLDWQAYYQLRNRLVTALLHSPHRRGGGVLRASLAQDLNHLLCLQYGSAALRLIALSDVLTGPGHLVPTLRERPATARAVLARLGQVVTAESASADLAPSEPHQAPAGAVPTLARMARVVIHQLRRPAPTSDIPRLPRSEGKWWRLGVLDAATVASATGAGVFAVRRDRALAARLTRGALVLRVRMWWRWPALARAYRAAAPGLASARSWDAVFGAADRSGRAEDSGRRVS